MVFDALFQIGEESMNARTNANLFNMSYFGKFYLSGPDSTKAAEWIFSNNMDKEPGRLILLVVTGKHVNITPTMRYFTGISRDTKSKSYKLLSLTECEGIPK